MTRLRIYDSPLKDVVYVYGKPVPFEPAKAQERADRKAVLAKHMRSPDLG